MLLHSRSNQAALTRRSLMQGAAAAGAIAGLGRINNAPASVSIAHLQTDDAKTGGEIILPFANFLANTIVPDGGVTYGSGQVVFDLDQLVEQGVIAQEVLDIYQNAQLAYTQATIYPTGDTWTRTDYTTAMRFNTPARANKALEDLKASPVPPGTTDQSDAATFSYSFESDLGGYQGTVLNATAVGGRYIVNCQEILPLVDAGSDEFQQFLGFVSSVAGAYDALIDAPVENPPLLFRYGENPVDALNVVKYQGTLIPAYQLPPELDALLAKALADMFSVYSHQGSVPGTDNYVFIDEYRFESGAAADAFVANYPSESMVAFQAASGIELFESSALENGSLVTWTQNGQVFGGVQSIFAEGSSVLNGTMFDTNQDVTGQQPDPNKSPWAEVLDDLKNAPLTAEEQEADRFANNFLSGFAALGIGNSLVPEDETDLEEATFEPEEQGDTD